MLPKSLQKLIESLSKLPGIGRKSAERLSYFLLRSHRGLAREIGESLVNLESGVALCRECFFICDTVENGVPGKNLAICGICSNPRREKYIICVVEHIFDAEAIERSAEFYGVYHILHGRIAPLDNITPEDLKIRELVARVKRILNEGKNLEIILATNPSSEGETTALYLNKLLKPLGIKLTRIATGIPVGADLEYADDVTLARAIKGRQNYE